VLDPHYRNPADIDQNLAIDDFKDVVKTSDPCGYQFDANDRLGVNHGGTNTTRPNHTGIDLQANYLDPVATVAHGSIASIGWQNPNDHNAGCGYNMTVNHVSGDVSTYCHLAANTEKYNVGDFVRAGTVIAAANSSGNSTGHHLHLSYWQNGQRIEYWNAAGNQPSASQLNGGC
jgi:murein DD-endopeptidase MepM/ murein hydrolase activator NlpD